MRTPSGSRALALVVLVFCTACRGSPRSSRLVRLIDQLPDPAARDRVEAIDGSLRPVLPPSEVQGFTLTDVPRDPVLTFAVGILPGAPGAPGAARFELVLQTVARGPVPIFERALHGARWSEGRLDLSSFDLDGATLLFRTTWLGTPAQPARAVWANPILRPRVPPARPSVLLISIDTLRADFLRVYGRTRAQTGSLDALAAEGVLYEQAYSPSTWTLPSHASLFYGSTIPDTPARMRSTGQLATDTLVADRPLPQILRDAGYVTAGFTGGGFLDIAFDFWRGFDEYFAFAPAPGVALCTPGVSDTPSVFAGARQWLRANRGQPFFLFVHTYHVHDRCPFGDPTTWTGQAAKMVAYYDSLIEAADAYVRALLVTLDELGLRDSTLVVLTSDHGEGFEEHGDTGHGCDMRPYEELARVPLLIRYPGHLAAGTRVTTPASLIDVAPTILALLGLPREARMTGGLLPGLGLSDPASEERSVYVSCGKALSVRRGPLKLIRLEGSPDQRYNVADDPRERRELPDVGDEWAALSAAAERFQADQVVPYGSPASETHSLDESARDRLRALGYLQ